jgi:hypothetical protein
MKTKLVVETILCLKNNKKVFLNGYDINMILWKYWWKTQS